MLTIANDGVYVTKRELKENRGWTDKAITILLGEYDKRTPNPLHKEWRAVEYYNMTRVVQAEQTTDFAKFKDATTGTRRTIS